MENFYSDFPRIEIYVTVIKDCELSHKKTRRLWEPPPPTLISETCDCRGGFRPQWMLTVEPSLFKKEKSFNIKLYD